MKGRATLFLYIKIGSHFLKDSILEVVGQDKRFDDLLSYIVIVSHCVTYIWKF